MGWDVDGGKTELIALYETHPEVASDALIGCYVIKISYLVVLCTSVNIK